MPVINSWYSFFYGFWLDIKSLASNANPIAIALCFVVLAVVFLLFERKRLHFVNILFALAAAAYGTFLLTITLLGRAEGNASYWDQLFSTYIRAFSGDLGSIYDVFYNIVLFIPVGFLTARCRKMRIAIPVLLIIPLCIELLQLITTRGVFEITDIINNFIGGLIGFFLARMIAKLFGLIKKKTS